MKNDNLDNDNLDVEKINNVVEKSIRRLMVGALESIENTYGKNTEQFEKVRRTILRIGNDQIRDAKDILHIRYIYQFKPKGSK